MPNEAPSETKLSGGKARDVVEPRVPFRRAGLGLGPARAGLDLDPGLLRGGGRCGETCGQNDQNTQDMLHSVTSPGASVPDLTTGFPMRRQVRARRGVHLIDPLWPVPY